MNHIKNPKSTNEDWFCDRPYTVNDIIKTALIEELKLPFGVLQVKLETVRVIATDKGEIVWRARVFMDTERVFIGTGHVYSIVFAIEGTTDVKTATFVKLHYEEG